MEDPHGIEFIFGFAAGFVSGFAAGWTAQVQLRKVKHDAVGQQQHLVAIMDVQIDMLKANTELTKAVQKLADTASLLH